MRKLLLNLFLSTVGLLFAGQASAQEEIAPESSSCKREKLTLLPLIPYSAGNLP